MNRWKDKLLVLLNIKTGEGMLVGLVLTYAILLYASNVLAHTASYALFLSTFSATNLPYTYVGISIAAPLISLVYLRFNQRYSLSTVLIAVHGFLLVTLVAYGLGLGTTSSPWLLFSLPIYFGVNNSLTISSFWNLLGRIYNLQQGKRLFGLLSSGEHLATIATGFAAPLLIARVGTASLFWAAALLMLATTAVLLIILRRNADKVGNMEEPAAGESPNYGRSMFANHYVWLIIGLFALFIIGVYFVDNIFYSQVELRFPNEDELAAFIAIFFGVFGVLSLFSQIFVAGRVLNRLGVRAMILATPVGLLILISLFALVGTFTTWAAVLFWIIVVANMYRSILDAIDSAAVNVMYQPLPAHQRTQAQTFVIGIVYPLSIGVTGLVLLFFVDVLGFSSVMLSYALLVILVVWLATAVRLGHAYPQQVRQALTQRVFRGSAQLQMDASSLAVLRRELASPHAGIVLYALDTLAVTTPGALGDALEELLRHPQPEIRRAALQRIEQQHLTETLTAVREQIQTESDPAVLAAALRTLAVLDERGAIDEISAYLSDPDPRVRQEALVGLFRNARPEVQLTATRRLLELVYSDQTADRVLAAHIIGDTAGPDQEQPLQRLLIDDRIEVRQAALKAAGKAGYPALWPIVAMAATVRATRCAADAALADGGETAVFAIAPVFNQPDQDGVVMRHLARTCGRIGGDKAIALLLAQISHPDISVRTQVLAALKQCGYRASADQQARVAAQINAEVSQAATTLATLRDLQKAPRQAELSLLMDVLQEHLKRIQRNIFYLLAFIYDPETMQRAWEALRPETGSDEERHAYALEIIDLTVAKDIKFILLPLINSLTQEEQLARLDAVFPQRPQSLEQRLQALLASPSPWLQLCAIYTVGRLAPDNEVNLHEVLALDTAAATAASLITETAVWTIAQFPAETVERILAEADQQKTGPISHQVRARRSGRERSLPAVARVAVLKQTRLFAQTPDEALLDVAGLLAETSCAPGESIFTKGDQGDSMYVVVSGEVRIHDGALTLNQPGAGGVFGEMALLDPEPRTASATAATPTHLLRLDREPFYQLLENAPEITRSIIRVLLQYLRASVHSLAELRLTRLSQPTTAVTPRPEAYDTRSLAPVERVLLLKRVELFKRLPDTLLTELAGLMQETVIAPDALVFAQGAPGDAMYIVARGRVRVHDAGHTLNYLTEGDVFGEMALLDSERRLASVTAVGPTRLLRLDQAPFFELLADHIEMAEAIIHTLSAHLRNRLQDLTEIQGTPSA